jgi:hypothetical protein
MLEKSTEDKIAFLNGLSDVVENLNRKMQSSEFVVNIIKSVFDETLLQDFDNFSDFLIDVKNEINEARREIELEELEELKNYNHI